MAFTEKCRKFDCQGRRSDRLISVHSAAGLVVPHQFRWQPNREVASARRVGTTFAGGVSHRSLANHISRPEGPTQLSVCFDPPGL